jgi:hypothetical protein
MRPVAQNFSGGRSANVTGRDVTHLPKILDHVAERPARRPGQAVRGFPIDDRPHLARCERVVDLRKGQRVQQRVDKRSRLWPGGFNAQNLMPQTGSLDENLGYAHTLDARSMGQVCRFFRTLGRQCSTNLMHVGNPLP